MKKLMITVLISGFLFGKVGMAEATLYDWSKPHLEATDPTNETGVNSYANISQIYYSYDNGYLYFRMDLVGTPGYVPKTGKTNAQLNYAESYGFYIDSTTEGTPNVGKYKNQIISGLPGETDGIDFIIGSTVGNDGKAIIYSPAFLKWNATGKNWDSVADIVFSNSGNTLEWRIGVTAGLTGLNNFNLWGVTCKPKTNGNGFAVGYDNTDKVVTPLPAAGLFLGSGLIGLIGIRRKRTV